MRLTGKCIALLLLSFLAACASKPPQFRNEALSMIARVKERGSEHFPGELASTLEAFQKGEASLKEGEKEDAERYYYLTLVKGELLRKEVRAEMARQEEAARLAAEQKRVELERTAKIEADRLAQAKAEALAQKEAAEAEHRKRAKPKEKEHPLVYSYTVRRGESLPLIASQPEVYGDRNLWPLIYRANRDQIRDPRHIWPGQVLKVPHNFGRDDMAEARRYALERPLH